MWIRVDELVPLRRVLPSRGAIANSAQATQLLQLGDDADKPAALAAIAAAAHHHRHRILALPATEEAATYADEHRYADTSTTAAAGIDNLQSGRWKTPTGSLLIIDDSDQLPAEQLHWVTTNTAATNTKLLLVTNTGAPPPRHTLTDVLASHLPWAQHLGAIDADQQHSTAMQPAAHHLTATPGDDTDHHTQARRLSGPARPTHRPLPRHHPAHNPARHRPAPRPKPRQRARTLTIAL